MSTPCFNRACAGSGARCFARRSKTGLTTAPSAARRRNCLPPPIAIAPSHYSNTKFFCKRLRSFSSISRIDDDIDEVKSNDGDGESEDETKLNVLKAALLGDVKNIGDIVDESAGYTSNASKLSRAASYPSIEMYSKSIYSRADGSDGASELEALTNALERLSEADLAGNSEECDTSYSHRSDEANNNRQLAKASHNYKPSLSELLETDIFTNSWAEPDREESTHRRSEVSDSSRRRFRINRSENRPSDLWTPYLTSSPKETDSNELPSLWSDERQLSRTEIEYNKLLEQTNILLGALSRDDDASTLQLMDFDKVMTQWSRFHVENDKSIGSDVGNTFESLNKRASDQCMRLLDALERNYDSILDHALEGSVSSVVGESPPTMHFHLMPNAASYNFALHALANSGTGRHMASEAYSMLMRILDRCQNYVDIIEWEEDCTTHVKLPPPPFEPTSITFNSTIHAIAKSGAPGAGHLAEQVFFSMVEWRNSCGERMSRHGVIDEEGIRSNDSTDVESNIKPLKDLYSRDKSPTCSYHGEDPNSRTLACVIDAWANTKASFAPERAEAILQLAITRRLAYVDTVMGRCRKNSNPFNALNHEQEWGAIFVEDLSIEEESVDDDLQLSVQPVESPVSDRGPLVPSLKPNTVSFNTCIHSWATSGRGREGALRAQELLFQLEALSESGELDLPIDSPCETYANENSENDSSLKPNVRTYSLVMNAWANVAKAGEGSEVDAASRCEDILMKMESRGAIDSSIRPNLVAYVTSISAWANTKGVDYAASKAEHILNRMIDLYYNEDASQLPHLDGDVENARHDAPFNSVITAYARSSDPCAAERALAVLERLEASPIEPSATSYNAAMDVCAKHGEPERALKVLDKMKKMSIPADATSYDTILNAFAKQDKAGSAERAYEYLCQLEQSSSESQFSPSAWSYATVINAFARASGKEYGGLHSVEKAKEIYNELVDKMTSGLIRGEADCFANSCLLNCCANIYGTGSEKRVALVTAVNAFEDMKKRPELHGAPNQYSYGTMMKVCVRLSSDNAEKHRLMESLFAQACKSGNVSKAVLDQFCRYTPPQLHMKVILSLGGTKREIPRAWYHNVPRRQWPATVEIDALKTNSR